MLTVKPSTVRLAVLFLFVIALLGIIQLPEFASSKAKGAKQLVVSNNPAAQALLVPDIMRQAQAISGQTVNVNGLLDNQQRSNAIDPNPVVPNNSLCNTGALAVTDNTFQRPNAGSSPCTLSAFQTSNREDAYIFNMTGCTVTTNNVTVSTCFAAACAGGAATTDTVLIVYQSPTGSVTAPFNRAAACTNYIKSDSDDCGVGETYTVSLVNGNFEVVVAGNNDSTPGPETVGPYSLLVNATGTGCTITQQPTAAPADVSGIVTTSDGQPLGGVTMALTSDNTLRTITDSTGHYAFTGLNTDTFYTVTPDIANYSFSPQNRSFSLSGSRTDATFTASANSLASGNPLDTPEYFVRQQYLDFLGREPDQSGLDFWSGKLRACGSDASCMRQERINVSAAFFQSDEFQQTGSFVYRLYKAGLGRQLSYQEFSSDRLQVVDQGTGTLSASRAAFANSFVQRAEFTQRYNGANSASSFVNALVDSIRQTDGIDLSAQRDALIARYQSGSSQNDSRSLVLRDAIEAGSFQQAETNPSFVLIEYFGYLKRDADSGGFNFWLDVLNNRVPGNYQSMVCAFLTSSEYQQRFSSVVTRFNSECGQ
ncbi:MAG TPA: DUF4214 domain-containing protein [Pyrinomonadaceae bacterium]|nr:DUF4214 domain-containing protein [Pyrinomonadaceae bacterium]